MTSPKDPARIEGRGGSRDRTASGAGGLSSASKLTSGPSRGAEPDGLRTAQHTAAKIAGVMYLLALVTATFSEFYARGQLTMSGDAGSIATSERTFRLGVVGDLITTASVVVLLLALYVVLKSINRHLALLAAFWRLVECSIFAAIALNDFVALRLLDGGDGLSAFDPKQLHALTRLFVDVHGAGYLMGLAFFSLGSTTFAYLWFKSRYIPRALAAWGIFASALVGIAALAIMVFPGLADMVTPAYFVPIFIFEVTLGVWLVTKGIRAPLAASVHSLDEPDQAPVLD